MKNMKHALRIVTVFLGCMSFAASAEIEGTATWNAGHKQLISFRLPTQTPGRRLLNAAAPATDPTDEILAKWGVADRASELKERSSETDMLGRTHTRYRQIYKGIEVDDRELIVHTKNGSVYEVNGEFLAGLALSVVPKTSVDGGTLVVWCEGRDAKDARLAWRVPFSRGSLPFARFVDAETGVELETRRTNGCYFKMAGSKGEEDEDDEDDEDEDEDSILNEAGNIEQVMYGITNAFPRGVERTVEACLPEQQGGADVEVTGTFVESENKFYFAATNKYGTEYCIYDGFAAPQWTNEVVYQAEAANTNWFRCFYTNAVITSFVQGSADKLPLLEDAVAISRNLRLVLDFYKEAFGRDSYDNKGGRVVAWRFWQNDPGALQKGFANAFWAGDETKDGKTVGNFYFGYDYTGKRSETSLDSCAHELTHGVTACTANLQYKGESGALNESFSDLIGAACEFACHPLADDMEAPQPSEADWLFDEDAELPDEEGKCSKYARSYADPGEKQDPSRYYGRDWADTNSDEDKGGVHTNSGVQNHFFYLLCEGGTGWDGEKGLENDGVQYDDFEGIGITNAAKIAYLALTSYCRPRTNYREVQQCWLSAAQDLCEENELDGLDWETCESAIKSAWAAVMPPFEELKIPMEDEDDAEAGFSPGDEVTLIGLLDWDTNVVHTVDNDGNITVNVPVDMGGNSYKPFRVTDGKGKNKLYVIAYDLASDDIVCRDCSDFLPNSAPEFEITGIELDPGDGEIKLTVEFTGDDGEDTIQLSLADERFSNIKVSDFLRLRQSPDPTFPADKSTDVNVASCKQPYEDEETEEEVPNKYDIILDLPKDDKGNIAPSGFYRLEW